MAANTVDRTERLDAAWKRFVRLRAILSRQRGDGSESSLVKLAEKLGTVAGDGRRGDTLKMTRAALDDMELQIERQALIELCGAFEATFKSRLPTASGEAARLLREHYKLPILFEMREGLVRSQQDFRDLKTIADFVASRSPELAEALAAIRAARNDAAHGVGSNAPVRVKPEQAYGVLRKLIENVL